MNLRIGFDLRPLQLSSQVMGIGVYIRNLLTQLSEIDRGNKYIFLTVEGKELPEFSFPSNFSHDFLEIPTLFEEHLNVFRDKFALHKIVEKNQLDIVHFPSPFELKIHFDLKEYNERAIITVHDLTPLIYGDMLFTGKRRLLRPLYDYLLRSVKNAGNIIAVSGNTRNDLVEKLNVPADKISIIHEAAGSMFKPINDREYLLEVRKKYNLPDKFILTAGGFLKHKNLDLLLDLIALLKVEYRIEFPVVMAGKPDKIHYPELKQRAAEMGFKDMVHFPGYVPAEDLAAFYNLSSVFIFPSLYEGFGLPLVEAMSCGTPCIISNVSSLPEIAGDAALQFDPGRIAELSEAVHSVLSSDEIAADLRKKGLKRAEAFSWKKMAEETLNLYNEAGTAVRKKQPWK